MTLMFTVPCFAGSKNGGTLVPPSHIGVKNDEMPLSA